VNNANVLGRIAITILAHTRAKGQPL
jgi:hypothetical protein